jgi:hypothetical protein
MLESHYLEISKEAQRIAEDSEHSAASHFQASISSNVKHLWLGIPAVIFTSATGLLLFLDFQAITVTVAFIGALLTALLTFLNPQKLSESHQASGDAYSELRRKCRILSNIDCNNTADIDSLRLKLNHLVERWAELNKAALPIPPSAFSKAKKQIDSGSTSYDVDKER